MWIFNISSVGAKYESRFLEQGRGTRSGRRRRVARSLGLSASAYRAEVEVRRRCNCACFDVRFWSCVAPAHAFCVFFRFRAYSLQASCVVGGAVGFRLSEDVKVLRMCFRCSVLCPAAATVLVGLGGRKHG